MVFGENMAMIEPDVIGGVFNGEYAHANIIGIDETILDKQIAVEKIKSLATKKFITASIKYVQPFKVPFFGKIILASNNEDKFMKVDTKEIRFWVRKLGKPRHQNHNILNDMIAEIPAFLHYLKSRPPVDTTKSRMVLTAKQICNKELLKVKEQSKSGLYHELCEIFTDFFYQYNLSEIECTPTDVKKRFFLNNNNIGANYIRKVLRDEFEFELMDFQRYMPFGEGDTKPGTPFKIERKRFLDHEIESDEVPF
jgi:hypothetical protein